MTHPPALDAVTLWTDEGDLWMTEDGLEHHRGLKKYRALPAARFAEVVAVVGAARAVLALLDKHSKNDDACTCALVVGWCPACGPHDAAEALQAALRALGGV